MRKLNFLCLFFYTVAAYSHAPGLSSVTVSLGADSTTVHLILAPQDAEALSPIDTDRDAELSHQEWERAIVRVADLVAEQIEIVADQRKLDLARPAQSYMDDNKNVHVVLSYRELSENILHFRALLLERLPAGHRQSYSVQDRNGRTLLEQVLTRDHQRLTITLQNPSTLRSSTVLSSVFNDYLHLGIEHILTGYDHLLFLFGLLIATRSAWGYFTIISCFTLAHSITLALATLDLVVLPADIVEPLIAATIAYVGLENLWRGERVSNRGWLTFTFGLVHGFGFAGALQSVGINNTEHGILIPLFAFNIGVELGQISVAALVWPIFQSLRFRDRAPRWRWQPVCSVMIILIGTYWLYERTVGGAN